MTQPGLPLEIQAREVREKLDSGAPVLLIDVREPHEFEKARIAGSRLIPMFSLPAHLDSLEAQADEATLIVYCHHGIRSLSVVGWLRQQG
ncbi:MAG: hypothetical protein HY822_20255, partial [Acidobacteria bacterium]|nr:hypothetical protein [Acidobacteriota bacterium]